MLTANAGRAACKCGLDVPGNGRLKDYGIEADREIPRLAGVHNVANHIRAVLDLLAEGEINHLSGLKREILANDELSAELFDKVAELHTENVWNQVSWFMGCEYGIEWLDFLKSENIEWPTNPNPNFEPVAPDDNSLLAFVQARITEFMSFQKISTLAGLFHSVLFRESEINRMVKIELRAFLSKLHLEELLFLKEIDHYPSDQILKDDYEKLCDFLKIPHSS